ncbi:MAG: PH domain-containing protein, partial [Candidatus Pacebacteria bacterium]|nr:PH domain-containing protein [Candidatus Paceibacterota bacterium]
LLPGETVVSVMRKHWFILFIHIMPYMLLFFLPFVIIAFIPSSGMSQTLIATIIFFVAVWMLAMLAVIFTVWTVYYLDIWIVTNRRIMDIEQKALFNREIKTLRMDTVQDVQVDVTGIFQTLLKFGTLRVQTAGTGGTDAKIIGIPDPSLERDIIMTQVNLLHP